MQLLRLADVPLNQRDRIFYYSRLRAGAGAVIFVAGATAAIIFGRQTGHWLAYYVAAVAVVCLLLYQKLITARFRPSNWLVRMTDHGLFVQLRSYLNCHFSAEDYTVVFLPYAEIRSATLVDERRELPDPDARRAAVTTSQKRRLLELELAGDSRQLAIALASEQEIMLAKTRIGAQKPSIRYHHFPVQLVAPDKLRIEWSVVPSAHTLLEALTRHTLVRPAQQLTRDLANLNGLSRTEQESRLLQLAQSGDKIGAIALARRLYGYDLVAAKDFVEGLASKPAEGKPSEESENAGRRS